MRTAQEMQDERKSDRYGKGVQIFTRPNLSDRVLYNFNTNIWLPDPKLRDPIVGPRGLPWSPQLVSIVGPRGLPWSPQLVSTMV